jgi:peptidoglycan/LPS O-acetylase OafA/YrhL
MSHVVKNRLEYIDALRGWAIIGVILTHAAAITEIGGKVGRYALLGGYGVQLFFVVSAFTIFLTFDRGSRVERYPVANFFTRRLMRIVPVYWMGVLLYSCFYGLASRGWHEGPELWHVPVHLLLLNLLHPATLSSVVPGGWSISCEVLFYLTVPIWFALIKNRRSALLFLAATLVLAPLTVHAFRLFLGE